MKTLLAKKKTEAVRRMEKLNICSKVIGKFKKFPPIIYISEPPFGSLYWLNEEEEQMVREFEEEHDALVYHVVRAYTECGILDSLLYVSDHEEEWEMDNEAIDDGYVMTYTVNHDMEQFSEFGSIVVQNTNGGLVRVG